MPKTDLTWAPPSIFSPVYDDKNMLISVNGSYWHNGAEMRFSMGVQASGTYLYRGTISVLNPSTGKVLQLTGQLKKNALDKREARIRKKYANAPPPEGKSLEELIEAAKSKPVYASDTLYFDSCDVDEIKLYLGARAIGLYTDYAALIHKRQRSFIRRDQITPVVALAVYSEDFWALQRPNADVKGAEKADNVKRAKNRFINDMKDYYGRMPNKPMADYTSSDIKNSWTRKKSSAKSPFPRPYCSASVIFGATVWTPGSVPVLIRSRNPSSASPPHSKAKQKQTRRKSCLWKFRTSCMTGCWSTQAVPIVV